MESSASLLRGNNPGQTSVAMAFIGLGAKLREDRRREDRKIGRLEAGLTACSEASLGHIS